jgi:hypothetical protein
MARENGSILVDHSSYGGQCYSSYLSRLCVYVCVRTMAIVKVQALVCHGACTVLDSTFWPQECLEK